MITPNWIVRGEYLHYGFNGGHQSGFRALRLWGQLRFVG